MRERVYVGGGGFRDVGGGEVKEGWEGKREAELGRRIG